MKMNGNGAAAAGAGGGITKADLERLIAAASQTAPAQTIRVEQGFNQNRYRSTSIQNVIMKPYLKWTGLSVSVVSWQLHTLAS